MIIIIIIIIKMSYSIIISHKGQFQNALSESAMELPDSFWNWPKEQCVKKKDKKKSRKTSEKGRVKNGNSYKKFCTICRPNLHTRLMKKKDLRRFIISQNN
jgi:hypothetical protein